MRHPLAIAVTLALALVAPVTNAQPADTAEEAAPATDAPRQPSVRQINTFIRAMRGRELTVLGSRGDEEDRVLLRLTPEPGAARTIDVRADTRFITDGATETQLPTTELPPTAMRLELEATDIEDEIFTTALTVARADLLLPPGTEPDALQRQLRAGLDALEGRTFTIQRDRRADIDAHDLATTARSASSPFDWAALQTLLPASPVAVGTRWRTIHTPDSPLTLDLTVVAEHTLEAVDDDTLTISTVANTISTPARGDDPDTNPIREILGVATATLTIDRRLGVPVEGEVESTQWISMRFVRDGRAATMTQAATTTTTITPVEEDDEQEAETGADG